MAACDSYTLVNDLFGGELKDVSARVDDNNNDAEVKRLKMQMAAMEEQHAQSLRKMQVSTLFHYKDSLTAISSPYSELIHK